MRITIFLFLFLPLLSFSQDDVAKTKFAQVFKSEFPNMYKVVYMESDNFRQPEQLVTSLRTADSLSFEQTSDLLQSFFRQDSVISNTEAYLDRVENIRLNAKAQKRLERIRSVHSRKQYDRLISGKIRKAQTVAPVTDAKTADIVAQVCPDKACPPGKTVRVSFDNDQVKCTCVNSKS